MAAYIKSTIYYGKSAKERGGKILIKWLCVSKIGRILLTIYVVVVGRK